MPTIDWDPLVRWFEEEKRDFPWRKEISPYRVWVSEVMLQQTQASVVVPYFERWMERWPTIEALAAAPFEEVIKMWEGLGYYNRVRYLYETAAYLVAHHGGILPSDRAKLASLKGFGPYTVGAVLSFAFRQKAAAVDGNVKRVLSRLFALKEVTSQEKYEALLNEQLPQEAAWVVMEGLIELGALVCQKKPRCEQCPLQSQCVGFQEKIADLLPIPKPKEKSIVLHREVAVIEMGRSLLLRQAPPGSVMAGLFEFPYIEKGGSWPFPLLGKEEVRLPLVKHTFTKYRVTLYPAIWKLEEKKTVPSYTWHLFEEVSKLPFSSGHRRVLHEYFTYRGFQ